MMRCHFAAKTVLMATVVALQACSAHHKFGAATPDRVVERYLLALETKDEESIAKLQPEATLNTSTADRITRLGGYKFQDVQIKYLKTKPTLWHVKITGTYLDLNNIPQKFEDNIALVYQGNESWKLYSGRWFLAL